ncbi:MAG: MvaI/BcnI restriction endonuclease family protein [Sedimentisphaerales bacterium]|nr:MvaI/BcnI restriction endonuclease family protein [Sedimentisphaerales bacterium]
MNLLSKEKLIDSIRKIRDAGWHRSVKKTRNTRNDGAVGNTLEVLLGIEENNLPIPNAQEWELKGQRLHSSSLITLKHIEPSPQGAKIVSNILLPLYGWPHKQAGKKYPANEMSFRSTTSATSHTKRGFRIVVDTEEKKVKFIFDVNKVNSTDSDVSHWLQTVRERVGLDPINPEPYWGFEDLRYAIGEKIKNCFYLVAESKVENKHEYFYYKDLYILSGFSFERFLNCISDGSVLIDFDARTGHNHGTKFRLKQNSWTKLYSDVQKAI